jgi:hypothetical protein
LTGASVQKQLKVQNNVSHPEKGSTSKCEECEFIRSFSMKSRFLTSLYTAIRIRLIDQTLEPYGISEQKVAGRKRLFDPEIPGARGVKGREAAGRFQSVQP